MKTQTIEVEGLPEGWRAVAFRCPNKGEYYYDVMEELVSMAAMQYEYQRLIVEKIQPRRIVLEETSDVRKVNRYDWAEIDGVVSTWNSPATSACEYKIWREVKEIAIPLTKGEPYLKLSVDECKSIFGCSFSLMQRVTEFIEDK